jgi:alpha-mannosidase
MSIRRASVILPCRGFDDFPTHLTGPMAADLLSATTALWHPAILNITREFPSWFPADELPDPASLEGELVLIPSSSRERMPSDWCDRLRAAGPRNPPPVDAAPSRADTIGAMLAAAAIDPNMVAADSVADFLALGHAHLQVELLTRALRYSSVLDTDQFTAATLAAADAAVAGKRDLQHEELSRAFDLLADARNHVYSVDFYVIDVTLLAKTTLGESLRAKLATNAPTNLLILGEQIEQIAGEHPETLSELRRTLAAGASCIVGGAYSNGAAAIGSPESLLAELAAGQQAAAQHLDRQFEIFGQFGADFSPLLPGLLKNLGFRGALHTAFDGGLLPKADQRKTNWGPEGASIEALSSIPLDISRPETWLKLAEQIGDTIAHDHVATILLAGYPGTQAENFDDLRRAARFGPVLGKLVTLEEYFRETREPDDWTKFFPREYSYRPGALSSTNPLSSRVAAYRENVRSIQQKMCAGLASIAGFVPANKADVPRTNQVVLNPWSVASGQILGTNVLNATTTEPPQIQVSPHCVPDVPGCGFARVESTAEASPVALAQELTLRNERLELTVSQKTGGIQSLRTHRDRGTRVSQRLVLHHETGGDAPESRMVADRIEITRNDPLMGEITSRGRLLGAADDVLANFTQRFRAVRGLPAMIVDVEIEPRHMPAGDIWKSYFASRLAWAEPSLSIRRGKQWCGQETNRGHIDSSEWIEIDDAVGRVNLFSLGLPFHRIASAQWLDTLLVVPDEERRQFQFAVGLDHHCSTHTALALLSACEPCVFASPQPLTTPRGWFVHIGAKNVLCTHIEPLTEPAPGIRLRLLETEGRETRTNVAAFRPFQNAWSSDFRDNRTDVLSVSEGNTEIDIGPHGWVQLEAEW